MDGYVGDGFTTDDKRGIIAIGSGMLDEEQRWRYGLRPMLADDMAVEEGLEIIVTVVGNLGGIEDSLDVTQEVTSSNLVRTAQARSFSGAGLLFLGEILLS